MNTSQVISVVGVLIAALGLLITILKERKHIETGIRAAGRKLAVLPHASMPRRTFLISVASVGAAASLHFVVRCYARSIFGGFCAIALPRSIVKNTKSGTLHHLIACADHLPADANRSAPLSLSEFVRIHRGKQVHIAELVGTNSQNLASETMLIEAIKASPTSCHSR